MLLMGACFVLAFCATGIGRPRTNTAVEVASCNAPANVDFLGIQTMRPGIPSFVTRHVYRWNDLGVVPAGP